MLYLLVSAIPPSRFSNQESPSKVPKETLENMNTSPAIVNMAEKMLNPLICSFPK